MRSVKKLFALTAAVFMIGSLTGCGQRETEAPVMTEKKETEKATEAVTETEKPTEMQTQAQPLITSVDYTSNDKSVKITLPDNTWKVTQDADEKRVFQSGNAAIINIVHATTEPAMANLAVMTSEEELKSSLNRQYTDSTAYEIVDYTSTNINGIGVYRYTVKFNNPARMWAYSVTNAAVASNQAYTVIGTVTDDNPVLLEAVKKAVESFQVLSDPNLKAATGSVIQGVTQKTTEKVEENTASKQELTSLNDYGAPVTLVSTDTVNVRVQPGTDSDILTMIEGKVQVSVVGETRNWFKVNINGNIGYIRKDFLVYGTPETDASTSTNTSSAQSDAELNTKTSYGTSITLYASDAVNVRSAPGTDASVADAVAKGAAVTVTGETDNWFIVTVNGMTGYISKAYLGYDRPATDDSSSGNNGSNSGNNSGNTGGNTGNNSGSTSGKTSVSGTVIGTTADSITVQGDDGNSYTIYYGDANVNSADGLYNGVYVNVSLDPGQAAGDGTLYATNVSGS